MRLRFGGTLTAVLTLAPAWMSAEAGEAAKGGSPPGMRAEAIHDRNLDMDAYVVDVPTDWHFQGALVYGTPCNPDAFPVFRVSSPDGLTVLERLPRLDWRWGPRVGPGMRNGCLPLQEEVNPSDFLRHCVDMLQVEYVAEVPVPGAMVEGAKRSDQKMNDEGHGVGRTHTDVASAKVRYRNGTFAMEGLLRLWLTCTRFPNQQQGPDGWWESCQGTVRAVRAPQGKLDEAVQRLEAAGARGGDPRWPQAYFRLRMQALQQAAQNAQAVNAAAAANSQAQTNLFNTSMAIQKAQHDQFMQSQASRQTQHEQSMATMQRGTTMSMQRSVQASQSSHAAASDMVDYALGQQTVRDPGTGQTNKVSSAFNQTWIDDTGRKSFQVSDPNANPNGVLPGTWTLQQQVHGDGTGK